MAVPGARERRLIVVCAATATEAAACRRGIAAAGAGGFEVLTTGVGPRRAAAALARHLAGGAPGARADLIVSSGFAGALTEDLQPLTWITASALHELSGATTAPVTLPAGILRVVQGVRACHVVSADRVVSTSLPAIAAAAAIDMESVALGQAAARSGVRFAVLRLVTDTPAQRLAPVAHSLAASLAADAPSARALHAVRAALAAMRSPGPTAAFLRQTSLWRERLVSGWAELAGAVAAARS